MKTNLSSTTPIVAVLGVVVVLSMGLYAALLLQRVPAPDRLFDLVFTIVGGLIGFLQHKPQDGGGTTP